MKNNLELIYERAKDAANYVKNQINSDELPNTGIILGSGLSGFENILKQKLEIKYSDIPGFMSSTAPGHAGKLILGNHEGKNLIIMSGRFHYYEGYSMPVSYTHLTLPTTPYV